MTFEQLAHLGPYGKEVTVHIFYFHSHSDSVGLARERPEVLRARLAKGILTGQSSRSISNAVEHEIIIRVRSTQAQVFKSLHISQQLRPRCLLWNWTPVIATYWDKQNWRGHNRADGKMHDGLI